MENLSLLSLAVVLIAASPLVATAWSDSNDLVVDIVTWPGSGGAGCSWSGNSYGANSTYEANLRHLAAVLPADTSAASHGYNVDRAVGYWPNRVQASAICWSSDGDCATCIAEAFKQVQRVCPFRRDASSGRDCYLRLTEYRIFSFHLFGRNTMVQALLMGMMFQAFGLACLFFLFIQAWRHERKRGNMTCHTPLLSGDQ